MKKLLFIVLSLFIFSCKDDDSASSDSSNKMKDASSVILTSTSCESNNTTLLELTKEEREALIAKNNANLTAEVFAEVNAYRSLQNLRELINNDDLLVVGIQHNELQIREDSISHKFALSRFCSIIQNTPIKSFAENTAFGFDSAQSVVEALLNSPNHKRNIEGDFDAMATSVVANTDGVLFYTQIFIKL